MLAGQGQPRRSRVRQGAGRDDRARRHRRAGWRRHWVTPPAVAAAAQIWVAVSTLLAPLLRRASQPSGLVDVLVLAAEVATLAGAHGTIDGLDEFAGRTGRTRQLVEARRLEKSSSGSEPSVRRVARIVTAPPSQLPTARRRDRPRGTGPRWTSRPRPRIVDRADRFTPDTSRARHEDRGRRVLSRSLPPCHARRSV